MKKKGERKENEGSWGSRLSEERKERGDKKMVKE